MSPVHTVHMYGPDHTLVRVYADESCTGEHSTLKLERRNHRWQASFYGQRVSMSKGAQFIGFK